MAYSASERFATTPELLYVLSSHVAYQKSLFNLSLVNKTFHAIFTPKLYSELWLLQEELTDDAETRALLENPNLRHVRILDVDATLQTSSPRSSFDDGFDLAVLRPDSEDGLERMTSGITVLLAETPAVKNFSWKHQLLPKAVTQALRENCPRLQSLFIQAKSTEMSLASSMWFGDTSALPLTSGPDYGGFPHLTSFALHDPDRSVDEWADIMYWLSEGSPRLTCLSLSMLNDDAGVSFLEDFCIAYRDRGGRPLGLRTLDLGTGFRLSLPSTDVNESAGRALYLGHLADLGMVEELHIWNGDVDREDDDGNSINQDVDAKPAWATICPSMLPRLTWLGIEYLDDRALQFLRTEVDHNWVRRRLSLAIGHLESLEYWRDQFSLLLSLFVGAGGLRPRSLLLPPLRSEDMPLVQRIEGVSAFHTREMELWDRSAFAALQQLTDLEYLWLSVDYMPRTKQDLDRMAAGFARSCAKLKYIRLDGFYSSCSWAVHHRQDGDPVLEGLDEWEDREARPRVFERLMKRFETEQKRHWRIKHRPRRGFLMSMEMKNGFGSAVIDY